jgi:hypothetical protein
VRKAKIDTTPRRWSVRNRIIPYEELAYLVFGKIVPGDSPNDSTVGVAAGAYSTGCIVSAGRYCAGPAATPG